MLRHVTEDEVIDICKRKGQVFEASREVLLPAGAIAYSLFRAGDKPVILFARDIGYNGVGVDAYAYRDPVLTSDGSLDNSIRNPNDVNPQFAQSSIYVSPVFSSPGEETRSPKYLFASESNQAAGQASKTIESSQYILPNSDILLVIENRDSNASQTISAELRWAEPDRIPGLIIQNGQFVAYNGQNL